MDFGNKNLLPLFKLGETQVYLTETLLTTWIVMAVLIALAVIVRVRLKHFQAVPKGFQNVIEAMVDAVEGMLRSMMGPGFENYGGFFFSLFAFILVSNYSGLTGLRPPTSDLSTTAALALTSFVVIHALGIKRTGSRYFKGYLEPVPIFLPMNIIGELAKPISLAFRLFGNILGGVIIMGLVYQLLPVPIKFIVPDILHAYFDLFAGALQAFIFTVLSMTFIQQKANA